MNLQSSPRLHISSVKADLQPSRAVYAYGRDEGRGDRGDTQTSPGIQRDLNPRTVATLWLPARRCAETTGFFSL